MYRGSIVLLALVLLVGGILVGCGYLFTDEEMSFYRILDANELAEQGLYDEAIVEYTKAIELDPNSATAYNNRGNAYKELGQLERAIEDYDEVIRINLKMEFANAKAYNNRGLTYYKLGQLERAIEDYDEAIRLNPEHAKAYYGRGLAYKKLGKKAEAIADFEKVIAPTDDPPDNPQLIEWARQEIEYLSQ